MESFIDRKNRIGLESKDQRIVRHQMNLDDRNVQDRFKQVPDDEVRRVIKEEAYPFAICVEHWHDYNVAGAVRAANGYGASEFYYVGTRRLDKRQCVGTHCYTPVTYLETLEALAALKEKYVFIALDNVPGSVSMFDFVWPENSLMILGSESDGLSKELLDMANHVVQIPMRGTVRSFNAAMTAGAACHDYVSKISRK